jgi:hypothetical protein
VYEPEDIERLTNKDDLAFLTAPGRRIEAEAFQRLAEETAAV